MDDNPKNPGDSSGDVEELRRRLAEAEGTLDAIRRGVVDAFVVEDGQGERVYTLKGADKAYSVFIETINEGLVALDSSNNILYSNTAFAHLVGSSPDRVSGSSAHRFIQEEDRPLFDRLMAQSIGGLTSRREFSILTETGDLVPMFLSFSNLAIAGINGACIVLTDLTEQKRAARDLQEQFSVLNSILESSNNPIFSIDADYLYSSFNSSHAAAMKALYGADIELGKSILAYMTVEEDRIEAKRNLDRALQGGQLVEAAYSGDEGHSRKYFEVSHNPIRNKRGEVTGVAVFAIDNTESKRAEETLRKSEEHFRMLHDNAGEAIFSYDSELILTDINRVGCEAIGYSREEILGKNILELGIIHPDDIENAANTIRRHIDGEDVIENEYTFMRKDGVGRLFTVTGAAIRDPDGDLQSITNICHDVTEERRVVEALRESEERFRQFADNLPEVVFEADSMGRFLYVNSNALEVFGYTEAELYSGSLTVLEMIAEEYREQVVQRMQKVLSEGPQGSNEYMARRKDGSVFPAIISTLPVVEDGIAVGLRGVLTDATAPKEAESEILRYRDHLEELVQERTLRLEHQTRLLERVMDTSPVGITVVDTDGQFIFANKRAEEILEMETNNITSVAYNDPAYDMFTTEGETLAIEDHPISRVIVSGEPLVGADLIMGLGSGQRRNLTINSAPVLDSAGKVELVVSAIEDTTDDVLMRKEHELAEEKARESEKAFRELLMGLSEGIWKVDADSRTTFVNEPMAAMLGYSVEEMIGKQRLDFVDVSSLEAVNLSNEIRNRGVTETHEVRLVKKNGTTIDALFRGSPVFDDNGDYSGAIAGVLDITMRKKAEEEINQLNIELTKNVVELEQLNKELESFSYSVSHDLRAPLRAIAGFSKMLAQKSSDMLDEEGKRLLFIIQENTDQMSELIEDLLMLSRAGQQDMRVQRIDLRELVSMVVIGEFKSAAEGTVHEFVVDELPACEGDSVLVKQIITNLLSNAVKFSRVKERPVVEIGFLETRQGQNVYFVKDNGVGFDEKYADKLFAAFQRLHSSDAFEGTGIGLALTQRIVQRHGGQVWAESEVGEGATFYFTLPCSPA